MDRLAEEFQIAVKHSRPRHSQSNEQLERFNLTLTRYLQRSVFDVDDKKQRHEKNKVWLKFLSKILFLYNKTEHCATKKSPSRLFLNVPGFNTIREDPNN
jgi:transposase InsO family protein